MSTIKGSKYTNSDTVITFFLANYFCLCFDRVNNGFVASDDMAINVVSCRDS